MSDTTPRLGLPYIAASQAQKHVTHNEALLLLDIFAGIIPAESRALTAPAGGESDGDAYILGGSGTGDWAGFDENDIAIMVDGAWRQISPSTGMLATVGDEGGIIVRWSGSAWNWLDARDKLTADRDYYVRTDGDDGNDGLSNTSGGAKLTVNGAIAAAFALDFNNHIVTIHIADGTYSGEVNIVGPFVGPDNFNGYRLHHRQHDDARECRPDLGKHKSGHGLRLLHLRLHRWRADREQCRRQWHLGRCRVVDRF